MKFKLLDPKILKGRLGCIYEVDRMPDFEYSTPNIVFYTNAGCIPNMTHEVMQMLTTENIPLQFPLDNIFRAIDAVEKNDTSLSSFVGLPEYFSYCILRDPTAAILAEHYRKEYATVWTRSGRHNISKERYMELMESFKPDMYVSISDCRTDLTSSKKKTSNTVFFSNLAFKYCYEKHISSPILKNKGLIAAVAGGYDLQCRESCAKYLAEFPILGYLIDGLFLDGTAVHQIPSERVETVISHTVKYLPNESLRIVHGAWEPKVVIKMIKLGIDLFDTSFVVQNTERGCALVFNYNMKNLLDDDDELWMASPTENLQNGMKDEEIPDYVQYNDTGSGDKTETSKSNFPNKTERNANSHSILYSSAYAISLYDTRYFDDFTPLVEDCTCLTCRKHTKSYIHHLLKTKEMLAAVLLIIHNLHHYMMFFSKIREKLHQNIKSN